MAAIDGQHPLVITMKNRAAHQIPPLVDVAESDVEKCTDPLWIPIIMVETIDRAQDSLTLQ